MSKFVLMPERKRAKIRQALKKREDVLRTQIRSVVQGYTHAMFVWGPGGLGKTHIIGLELESIVSRAWQHHTGSSTAKGLVLSLVEYPDQVHVFEDCESMYKNETGSQILRSACASPRGKDRIVKWETAHDKVIVNFKGGIIIATNENIAKGNGPLAAVASRFRPICWDLNAEERMVRMLDMADQGYNKGQVSLTAKECREVAHFLIEEMKLGEVQVPIDLRTYCEHALPAFAQAKHRSGGVSWKDIIRSKLQGQVGKIEKREERSNRLEVLALGIHSNDGMNAAQKALAWKASTGLGRAIYYQHVRRAQANRIKV